MASQWNAWLGGTAELMDIPAWTPPRMMASTPERKDELT